METELYDWVPEFESQRSGRMPNPLQLWTLQFDPAKPILLILGNWGRHPCIWMPPRQTIFFLLLYCAHLLSTHNVYFLDLSCWTSDVDNPQAYIPGYRNEFAVTLLAHADLVLRADLVWCVKQDVQISVIGFFAACEVTVSIFSASSEDERRHRSNSTISARVPPILVLLRNPAVLPGPPNFFRQVYVHEADLAAIERAGLFLGNSPSVLARRMGAALATPWQATTPGDAERYVRQCIFSTRGVSFIHGLSHMLSPDVCDHVHQKFHVCAHVVEIGGISTDAKTRGGQSSCAR